MISLRQLDRLDHLDRSVSNIQHSKDFIEEWNRVSYFSKGSGDAQNFIWNISKCNVKSYLLIY